MPSILPTPENKYYLEIATAATRAILNAIFGSIGTRLDDLEGRDADYEAAIDAITTTALQIVSANITEEVDAQRIILASIRAAADAIVAEYEAIQESGVPATSVSLAAISGLAASNVQAAIALIVEAIGLKANAADFATLSNTLTGQVQTAINAIDTRAQTIALSIAYSGAR